MFSHCGPEGARGILFLCIPYCTQAEKYSLYNNLNGFILSGIYFQLLFNTEAAQ